MRLTLYALRLGAAIDKGMAATNPDTTTWPDLAIGLYDKLTGRGAEITYEFSGLEISVPSSASSDAKHATWRLNGTVKIRTRMPNNQPEFEVDLAIEHDGHRLHLTGRDPEFTAEIPSFLSLLHFLRAGWPYRYLLPAAGPSQSVGGRFARPFGVVRDRRTHCDCRFHWVHRRAPGAKLIEAGYRLRCLVRSPEKLAARSWSGHENVEVFSCDLSHAPSLAPHLKGCTQAIYLVHSMISAGKQYGVRDRLLAEEFAKAARSAGILRILYLGGLGETGPELSEHLSSRREVETALASTGIPVTVLRAAMIIGSGSASFEILRYLVERLPVMITPRWVSTRCQPIAVRNVIGYLAGCLSRPETAGRCFDIGGPEVMRYRDIMRIMAEELGLRHRWVIPVPVLSPRLSSYWIHLVTPLSHDIGRPLAEGLRNPVV